MADFISFSCNFCGTLYRVPFAQAGQSVQCKQCKRSVMVPTQSQAMAPGMLETNVEMNAGEQVLRKETSARQAPISGISTRRATTSISARGARTPSGRTPSVLGAAPVVPIPVLVAPAQPKSAMPLVIGLVAVVVVGALVTLIIVLGMKEPARAVQTANSGVATPKPKAEPAVLSEPEKIRRELEDPALSYEKALALYRRAQSAKLTRTELADIARRVLNMLYNENGATLSAAQGLALFDEFAGYDISAETVRVARVFAAREPELLPDGKANEAFLRLQKLLGREKLDFDNLAARCAAMVEAEQAGASDLATKFAEARKAAVGGWVEKTDLPALRVLVEKLTKMESDQAALERENPTLKADRERFKKFKAEKAARASSWTFISDGRFVIYIQLTEAERKAGASGEADARSRAFSLKAIAARIGETFQEQWVQPLALKRALPRDLGAEEREKAPIEIVLCRDNKSLVNYASYIGEQVDSSEPVLSFYTLKSQRVCVSSEELGTGDQVRTDLYFSLNLISLLFNFHSEDPLLRDEDQANRGVMHSMLLDRSLFRCILTPVRAYSTIYQLRGATSAQRSIDECVFFDEIDGLGGILGRWRKPFSRGSDGKGIESFGGAAFSVRNLVEMKSEEHGSTLLKQNFLKMPGISEELATSMSRENNFRLLATAYSDALLLFLYHFQRDGKHVYRDGLLKFIAKDLGGLKRDEALKGFEEAFGLNEAKWKQLEQDFLDSQK